MTRRSNYITPEGARRLSEELDHLWKVERPRVTREVAAAAAQGDRSENAEYIYGKRRLREIDRRLRFLSKRLDELEIVEPRPRGDGKVRFGAWVGLEDEDGRRLDVRIVGPDEVDPNSGHISVDSPVGRALIGRCEGDDVRVERPRGAAVYSILEVRYRPSERDS